MGIPVGRFRMKIKLVTPFALVGGFLMVCGPLLAHHSMAMYDMKREITLTGSVTEFRFMNPHVQILFDVADDQGNVVNWSSLFGNPSNLRRAGWNKNTIQLGDQITITGNPRKNGRPLMSTKKILLNGKELPRRR